MSNSIQLTWKKVIPLLVGVFFAFCGYAQDYLPYNAGWQMVAESETFLDLSLRVTSCNGKDQVHIWTFNENSTDQTAEYTLEISSNGKSFQQSFRYDVAVGDIITPECTPNPRWDQFKLDLPPGYDPQAVEARVFFKPKNE